MKISPVSAAKKQCAYFLIIAYFFPCFSTAQSKIVKSSFGLSVDLPMFNESHYYDYVNEKESIKSGHLGIGFYVYYEMGKNKFSFGYEAPMVNPFFSTTGGSTNLTAHIIEALFHHRFISIYKKITLNGIIGLNTAKYTYIIYSDYGGGYHGFTKYDQTLGLTGGIELEPFKFFAISFLYRPGLIDFGHPIYHDVFSLSAKFNINVWRKKINLNLSPKTTQ